jgi:hypothetical protein
MACFELPTTPIWRRISPSAELMVTRCTVRDTRGPGADRFQWSVTFQGRPSPVAAGGAAELVEARERAESALASCAAHWRGSTKEDGGD